MYTQEQTQALKEYNKALKDYNTDQITYEQYVEITFPLWNKLNTLFEKNQKSS